MRPLLEFQLTLVALVGIAFTVAALLSPPDPFTQLLYAAPLVVLAFPLAYWLVYHGGERRLLEGL